MLSIRFDSFFAKSKLPLNIWIHIIQLWAFDTPLKTLLEYVEVSEKAAIDCYNFLRDICSWKLLQQPVILGGRGCTVQIGESLFKHKPKYHRGRATAQEKWVFGIVDVSTQPATGYMELVPRRDAATLLPIIRQHVHPGSTIHSDEWRAYSSLQYDPHYHHYTVNHSLNFVNPVTGVHTQHVESYWGRAKAKLKRMHGTSDRLLPSYLDEFMWRERYSGGVATEAFFHIFEHIAEKYPLP